MLPLPRGPPPFPSTALSPSSLTLDYYTSEPTAAPFAAILLPGSHLLAAPGGGVIFFTLKTTRPIDYHPALDSTVSCLGTRQLTINGARVTIDATALTTSSLA